jgi:hypothetical protein
VVGAVVRVLREQSGGHTGVGGDEGDERVRLHAATIAIRDI